MRMRWPFVGLFRLNRSTYILCLLPRIQIHTGYGSLRVFPISIPLLRIMDYYSIILEDRVQAKYLLTDNLIPFVYDCTGPLSKY